MKRSSANRCALPTLALVITAVLVFGSGCSDDTGSGQPAEATTGARAKAATIKVTGTSGTPFRGTYGSAIASTESVEGEVPQDYEVYYYDPKTGAFGGVEASMQKREDDYGRLTVQVIVDGETKKERTTAAGFGVAKVSWYPGEE